MMNTTGKCDVCGVPKEKGDGHRHCSSCGIIIKHGAQHSMDCSKVRKIINAHGMRGRQCPSCMRLLAAGAHCPVHGAPFPCEEMRR